MVRQRRTVCRAVLSQVAAFVNERPNSSQPCTHIITKSPVGLGVDNHQGLGVRLKNRVGAKAQPTC